MIPTQEKALELLKKFNFEKESALICVDEILKTTLVSPPKTYWKEVKNEILKIYKNEIHKTTG